MNIPAKLIVGVKFMDVAPEILETPEPEEDVALCQITVLKPSGS
jgi:hypothetical protein